MEQMRQINVGGLRVEKSWALPPSSSVSPGEALSLLSKLHVPRVQEPSLNCWLLSASPAVSLNRGSEDYFFFFSSFKNN